MQAIIFKVPLSVLALCAAWIVRRETKKSAILAAAAMVAFAVFLLWTVGLPRKMEISDVLHMLLLDAGAAASLTLLAWFMLFSGRHDGSRSDAGSSDRLKQEIPHGESWSDSKLFD